MRVAVIGQGYVGLPLTVALVGAGHTVVAVESNPDRVAALRRKESYIADVSDLALAHACSTGRLTIVDSLGGQEPSNVYLIAVPTPTTDGLEPDLRCLDAALESAALTAKEGALIIVESTVYPGATRGYVIPRFEELSGLRAGIDVDVVYSPERIDPGREDAYRDVPKIVGGLTDRAVRAATSLYETVFTKVVTVGSLEVAEFVKLFENIFRYVNIAVVNELNQATQAMDIDFRQVVAAAASKPYGFMPFSHGPGVGGHCLPNNVHYLNYALRKVGRRSTIIAAAAAVNDHRPAYVVDRIEGALCRVGKPLAAASVLILGLAYKPGVGDDRHSPTYAISEGLVARGARVKIADPLVPATAAGGCFERVELTTQQCRAADIVVIATDHHDFDYNLLLEHAALILDCRGRLDSPRVEQL